VTVRSLLLPALLLWSTLACAPLRAQTEPRPGSDAAAEPVVDAARLRDAAFDPAVLRQRRERLLASLPPGAVVVVAAGPVLGDTWAYRPDPDFLYLTGQRDGELALLLAEGVDVAFAPPRNPTWELWNGPRLAPGTALADASGFAEVRALTELNDRIVRALPKDEGTVYLIGVSAEELELPEGYTTRSCEREVAALRQVKDAGELALLQRAIDITCAALTEAIRSIEPGQPEYEIQAVIEYLFGRYGAQRPGFGSIVGAGPNSCVLHYNSNRGLAGAGQLVVMDVGAELWGYTADVTRTVPVSGRFTPRQREVYEVVLRAQEAGIAACRPGATIRDVHAAARRVIREAGYGEYFPHGTSHWLGLDVHDVGAYGRALEPGMVLTVEPGIYIAAEQLGIRIEDDVVVTEDGCRLLSGGVPPEPDAIEAMMREAGVGNQEVAPIPRRQPPAGGGEDQAPARRFFHTSPR
jgi:Xaa-Pro aminopeptidase